MALASISLRGLRNLAPTTIEFDRGANYLFGPNGAGKTNLLEAIHYLAIGRSFRRCPDADLLGFGKNVLAVSGADEKGEGAEIRFDGREKRLLRDDVPVQKLSEYFGWLPVVVLLLEDIELVRGAPGIRRSFLDVAIAKTGARAKAGAGIDKLEARAAEAGGNGRDAGRSYIALMGEYRRAVSQYNRLLEKAGRGREQGAAELEAWEQEVARTGAPVCEMRLAKLGELLEYAAGHYERLAGHGAEFSYRSSVEGIGTQSESSGDSVMALSRAFRQRLAMTRERALVLGHALVGPHRDDIRITRSGRELRRFGSVGEQRLAGIALRLAEADMILSAGRQRPVFLLDEVASELDERRSRMVLEMVAERGQMVYAAARRIARPREGSRDQGIEGSSDGCQDAVHDAAAPDHFSGKEFHVEAGKVSEVS